MKFKNINKVMLSSCLVGLTTLIAIPFVTSCSSSDSSKSEASKQIIQTNNDFVNKEKTFLVENDSMLPKFVSETEFENNMKSLKENAVNAKTSLENLKKTLSMNQNEKIWLDSYIFQWENKIKNIESGMIFLGANPITGGRVLGSSANHIASFVKDGINIYPLNEETGDPDEQKEPDKNLVQNLPTKIEQTKDIINEFKNILNYGATKYGFMPSSISKKLLVNQLVDTFYQNQLKSFFNDNQKQEITISELVNLSGDNYFSALIKKVESYYQGEKLDSLKAKLNDLDNALDEFVAWYASDYYANENSFGKEVSAGQANQLKLQKASNNEVEKSLIVNNQKVYGLGLTNDDLSTTGIGIGYMKLKGLDSSQFLNVKDGNGVYQQLLNNNNSINTSATDIYKKGIELTKNAKANMDAVAKKVKEIVIGDLNDQIKYDEDGIGPKVPTDFALSSLSSDFEKFNKWLNQEDFFFGREIFSQDQLTKFNETYWTNASGDLKRYKDTIIKQGYETPWLNSQTINGESTGTVTGLQALAGAVLSYQEYEQFKKVSDPIYDAMFNSIPDYVLAPYNYAIRVDIGVGMEGPRGSNQFQYNCDPYYSLPKWSLSSLTTHEGKMGHHTQNAYWTKYLQGGDGANGSGPSYTFVNDAFHEGWAVFSEWYANELGMYGSQLDEASRMPSDFLHAKGIAPVYDSSKLAEQTKIMKQLHGGVYYMKAKGADGSDEKLQNSIKLANMLQYYGYLNEAQLRNMRLCLDVAYHFKGSGADSSLAYGASIKGIRDYMTSNSALSVGDISSESIRYAVMPSQATGYMLGKEIFEELYKSVQAKLNKQLNDISNSSESKKLFDLMLRNGEIPLEVLKQIVKEEYGLN